MTNIVDVSTTLMDATDELNELLSEYNYDGQVTVVDLDAWPTYDLTVAANIFEIALLVRSLEGTGNEED